MRALRAAAGWRSDGLPWPSLIRDADRRALADPHGLSLFVAGLVVLAVTTWQLLPLAIPALGCLLMQALGVERRNPDIS